MIAQKKQTEMKVKMPKMICGIIATISIVVIGFFLLSTFWFWTCLEIIGGFLVAVGCIGEWYLFGHPAKAGHELSHRRSELQYIVAVAVGVSMEFLAILHSIPETIRLERNVVDIGTTNAQLVASNLAERAKVDELEQQMAQTSNNVAQVNAKITPRTFNAEQIAYAHVFWGKFSGTPFVMESFADPDSTRFAEKLESLLNNCNWTEAGIMNGGNIFIGQGAGGSLQTAEPIGVVIEVNQNEPLKAGSALDLFLYRCHIESKLSFVPNPQVVVGGQGVHVRVGTQK